MKFVLSFNSVFFLLLSSLMSSCLTMVDPSTSGTSTSNSPTSNSPTSDSPQTENNDLPIDRIRIDSQVLAAMKDQIASQPPMRGGSLFGAIKGGEINLQYFLYDYASEYSPGSYKQGENLNSNLKLALGYEDEEKNKPLALYLGHTHSMPGTMNYVTSGHEVRIETFFEMNPQFSAYLIPIITIGPENMASIESHELKLGDNAKVSFFVKARGQSAKKMTQITTYDSNADAYKKMNSYVSATAHIFDIYNKFNLKDLEAKITSLTYQELRNLGLRDLWLFSLKIPQKRKEIQVNFPYSYPKTSPELTCVEITADSKSVRTLATERMPGWQSNEKNSKNFEQFFENFIDTKCPIR
jgi:hypothetical protein